MVAAIPDKLFYKIGEVADLLEVKTHVLRYWESEFPQLAPVKSRSNQRLYRRSDVETALTIKDLLYRQGFTICGARERMKQLARAGQAQSAVAESVDLLSDIRTELLRIRERLEPGPSS